MAETQELQVLRYLNAGNSLTSLEALKLFGCMRLAAVVNALRQQGYRIETQMIGESGKRYADYRLRAK